MTFPEKTLSYILSDTKFLSKKNSYKTKRSS